MAFRIEDGEGTGKLAEVTDYHRLSTSSVIFSVQAYSSFTEGRAFQVFSGVRQVTSPGAYGILALRNDIEENILITYIRIGIDKTEVSQAQTETLLGGTWSDGSAVVPVNCNAGSGKTAGVTAHYNSIPSGSAVVDTRFLSGPGEVTYNKEGSMILPRGQFMALRVTTETANVNIYGRISFVVIDELF